MLEGQEIGMDSMVTIFGLDIPLYGIFFYLGIVAAAALAFSLRKRAKIDAFDIAGSGVYVMIGGVFGAKLLFLAVSARQIIQENIPLIAVIKGGFVFYGGLLGGALGLLIYAKQYRMDMARFADLYTTILPLGHALGRLGCFFAGCCYGIPWKYGHVYHSTVGRRPLNEPLLPIQLIESGVLLALFGLQLLLYVRHKKTWRNTVLYLSAYPVIRFILEFFRGDVERGIRFGLSTSQWASLGILTALSITLLCTRHKRMNSNDTV